MVADDPYLAAGASLSTNSPSQGVDDPYAATGATEVTAPTPQKQPSQDPYEAASASAAPPLSEDDFQQKLKSRWGSMLTGQSMATPTDIAEMQSSGRFTPEQMQRVQTETALRQAYTDQQAQTLGQKAATVGSSALSGLGSMAQDLLVAPRLYQEYKDLSQSPSDVGTMEKRVATSIPEGLSEAATGLLGLGAKLITGPASAIKTAYDQYTGAPSNPEQDYQNWKLNYLKTHAIPGYAAPPTTSRVQDLESAITGQPAENFPAPIAPITSAVSTFATLPMYGGAGKVAESVIPKALEATGVAKTFPNLSEAITPTAPGAVNAGKLKDAMTKALSGTAEQATPSLASKAVAGAGKAVSAAGKAAQVVGAAPANLSRWLTEKVTGSPELADQLGKYIDTSGWLAAPIATAFGSPALGAAIGAVKFLEKGGAIGEGLGDFMTRVATANPTDPFGRFMALAADKEAPTWMRQVAQSPGVQFALKAGNLAGNTAAGFAKGAATGAGLSLASGDSPEEMGGNIAGMGLFGAAHGAMSGRESKIFGANVGAVTKFISDYLDSGGSPDTLRLVPAGDVLQAALWNNANPDWKIRFATSADANSPFAPGGNAEGQAGIYDRENKTQWIDPTKRAPGATLTHEAFHPIFDNLVSQQPDVVDTLNNALAKDGRSIDDFKQQYAARVFPNDPQGAAEYIKTQDAANPGWAYSELLSDSAAHELTGKNLLEAMQGKSVQQSATQTALNGMDDWLSAQGVQLKDSANGTVFPDFQNVFTSPDVRKLTYKMLKAQRETVLGNEPAQDTGRPLTKADMGTKTAPFYTTPEGQKINPYGQMVPNGKGGESFRAWPASELKKRGLAEAKARLKYFPLGKTATSMPAGLEADPDIAPWTKTALRNIFDSIQGKNKLSLWYHRLNSENSATSDKSRAADLARTQGNVRVSWQSGKPLGVELTKKGNLITRWESEEAENQKLADWANRHGDLSLDLWGGDQAKAKADIQTYLQNHATGQPGESNGLGTQKRDVINALLTGGNKEFEAKNPLRAQIRGKDRAGVMRSLRVDRMESATPDISDRAPADWEKLKRNLSPGELQSGTFSPSADPRAVKTAAIRDEETGKIYTGSLHPAAIESYLNDKFPEQDNNHLRAWNDITGISQGFVTNGGEFLDRKQAYQRAMDLKQYKPEPRDDGELESTSFRKQAQTPEQFSPASNERPTKRDIELTGPDGKKYPAWYDGIQEGGKGIGYIQITPKVGLPGATVQNSTTYHPSLEKKGYSLPPELYTELKNHLAAQDAGNAMQFSPSPNPRAIKTAAIRDTDTGKIYEGEIHYDGFKKLLSDKYPNLDQSFLEEEGFFDTVPNKALFDDGNKGGIRFNELEQLLPGISAVKPDANWENGFVTGEGEFLNREEAYKRAIQLKQLDKKNRAKKLESLDFNYRRQFSPSPNPRAIKTAAVRDPETGEVYEGAIHADAMVNYFNSKFPDRQRTRIVIGNADEYPEVEVGFTTNNGKFLNREEAYKRALSLKQVKAQPPVKEDDSESPSDPRLEARVFNSQKPKNFSPSADPHAIASAAVRDKETGRIFAGDSHVAAAKKSPKAPQDLEDGFVTNSGEFLTRDQALERAVAAKQYKPSDEDYNVNKILYGMTSERFNKQNPDTGAAVAKANEALDKVQPTTLRPGIEPAIRWKGKVYTNAELEKTPGATAIDKLRKLGVLKDSDWTDVDYDDETKPSGYLVEHGFANSKGKWVKAKDAYEAPKQRPTYSPTVESKNVRQPDEEIRKQASDYTKQAGISRSPFTGYAPLNEELGKRVADAYDAAPHIPDNPKVQSAYQALAKETRAQWDYLTKKGVTFEPWTKEGQPYQSSKDMRKDVQQNKHLWFFPTQGGFGEGDQPSNNPMLQPTGIESDGVPLVTNDLFRAVHDYFGHAKEGYEFGPRGEYNAYLAHSRMFSDRALPALTAETMGQNSWVNFGKHLRDEAGNIPKKGEVGYKAPQDRPFAEQKATVLPDGLTKESLGIASPEVSNPRAQFSPTPSDNDLYEAGSDFLERRDYELLDLAKSLKASKGKGQVAWKTVPAEQLKKVWMQYGRTGHINADELNSIADRVLTNIARLRASTEMMGHTQLDVRPELEENGFKFTDKQWDDWMSSHFTDKNGNWVISDYGLPKLEHLYVEIYAAKTAEDKLFAIDKALNVIHQRSDLAALFVQGGSKTLLDIANQGGYSGEGKPGQFSPSPKTEAPTIGNIRSHLNMLTKTEKYDEKKGLHYWDSSNKQIDSGTCTNSAWLTARKFGGQVFGYGPNESAKVGPRGHDFAIVGDYLVDWWGKHVSGEAPRAAFNLTKDAKEIEELYGPKDKWKELDPKLWMPHRMFGDTSTPFDTPSTTHPETLTRQEMSKWLLENKAWDSTGALDAKAARWIARKGKSWVLTTIPTEELDYALDEKSHAAPGQPIVAHLDKDGVWEVLDGQHRASEAFRSGVKSLPAYIPAEDKAQSFSPSATDPIYYSKLKNTVDEKFSGESMPAAQLAAVLRNPANGLKADELKWSGIDDFLKGKHRVSKEEVHNFVSNQDMTPMESTKSILQNYKIEWKPDNERNPSIWMLHDRETQESIKPEVWIVKTSSGIGEDRFEIYVGDDRRPVAVDYSGDLVQAQRVAEREAGEEPSEEDETQYSKYVLPGPKENYREILFQMPFNSYKGNYFKSPHWDEENVIAHTRVDDRVNSHNQPGLFVEEIQSDWHQEGRKHGYLTPEQVNNLRQAKREGSLVAPTKQVPDAPLRTTWQETVFRRLVQMAAQTGKDWIGWTTGKQQADRYSLENHIQGVRWGKQNQELSIKKHGEKYFSSLGANVPEDELQDYIGKELAEKLVNSEPNELGFHELSGLDVRTGGEGMSGFYDKILVDYANKFGKKFGARVTDTSLDEDDEGRHFKAHMLPITPEMKESVKKGISMYSPAVPTGGTKQSNIKPAMPASFHKLPALAAPPVQSQNQPS